MDEFDDLQRLASLRASGLGAAADPAFDRITALVRRLLGVPVSLVSLVTDTEQVFPGQSGLTGHVAETRRTPLSHSFCQHVVVSGEPLVIPDARVDVRVRDSLAIPDLGVVGYLGYPICDADGRTLGSLCAIAHEPRTWTDEEQSLLSELAEMAGSELRLRHAAAALNVSLHRSKLLQQVGEAVGATLDSQEAVARLSRLMVPALAEWCTVGLVDRDGAPQLQVGRHAEARMSAHVQEIADAQTVAGDASPQRRAVLTGEPVQTSGPDLSALVGTSHLQLMPGCALTVALGRWGYLTLGRGCDQPFTSLDTEQLLDLGRRVGLALENADLYREQRNSAEALQRSLLTDVPEPDHLHIEARYVPAGRVAQVGGDWYDAFLQTDGSSVLVVGDVMGHDMQAAGMMGQVRNILRGVVHDKLEPPAQLVTRVDRALQLLQVETLATLVVARIEQTPAERAQGLRRMVWANAGHPPPVLIRPDGTVQLLETVGEMLVGFDVDAARTDHEVVLEVGSTVLLYTDGLVERRLTGVDQGLVRLRQALGALAHLPLDELVDQLLERLSDGLPEDDVALVGLRLFPEDQPRPAEAGPEDVPDLVP